MSCQGKPGQAWPIKVLVSGEPTALTSAARTATQTSEKNVNDHWSTIHLVTDITAWSAGSLTPKLQGWNGLVWYDILVGPALGATGTNVLKLGPGFTPSPNAVASDRLPPVWRAVLTAGTADSITYSCQANVMP